MLSHENVIEAFGGTRQLAEAIGIKPELAIHWRKRGIPAKFWPLVEITPIAKTNKLTTQKLRAMPVKSPSASEAA